MKLVGLAALSSSERSKLLSPGQGYGNSVWKLFFLFSQGKYPPIEKILKRRLVHPLRPESAGGLTGVPGFRRWRNR